MSKEKSGVRVSVTQNVLNRSSTYTRKSYIEAAKRSSLFNVEEPVEEEQQPSNEPWFYVKWTKRESPPEETEDPLPKNIKKVYDAKASAIQLVLFGREDIEMKKRLKAHVCKLNNQIHYIDQPSFMRHLDPASATARAYELKQLRQAVRQALLKLLEYVIGYKPK